MLQGIGRRAWRWTGPVTLFSVVEELRGGAVKHIDAFCGILDRVGMDQINMETSVQNRTDSKKSVTQMEVTDLSCIVVRLISLAA